MPPRKKILEVPVATAIDTKTKVLVGTLTVCSIALLGAFASSMMAGVAGLTGSSTSTTPIIYSAPRLAPEVDVAPHRLLADFTTGKGKITDISFVPGMSNCFPMSIIGSNLCQLGEQAQGSKCGVYLQRNPSGSGRCVLKISYINTAFMTDAINNPETRYFEQNSMTPNASIPESIKEVYNPAPTPTNLCGLDKGQPNSDGPANSLSYLCTQNANCSVTTPVISTSTGTWNWTCSLVDVGKSNCSAPVAPPNVAIYNPTGGETWTMGASYSISYRYTYDANPTFNPNAYIALIKDGTTARCLIGQQPSKTGKIDFTLNSKIKCGASSTTLTNGTYKAEVVVDGTKSIPSVSYQSGIITINNSKCFYTSSTNSTSSSKTATGYLQTSGVCDKYSATCDNGQWKLNGYPVQNFFYACKVMASCSYVGEPATVLSGTSASAYPAATSTNCKATLRTCTNGKWSGTAPAYRNCTTINKTTSTSPISLLCGRANGSVATSTAPATSTLCATSTPSNLTHETSQNYWHWNCSLSGVGTSNCATR